MDMLPLRLNPGQDLRAALQEAVTTAEVRLALLPHWHFAREPDARTGFDELTVRARGRSEPTN